MGGCFISIAARCLGCRLARVAEGHLHECLASLLGHLREGRHDPYQGSILKPLLGLLLIAFFVLFRRLI